MKKPHLSFLMLMLAQVLSAQTYVSTNPEHKKVILEEFTSTECSLCPGGHLEADKLLTENPGNLFVIAYHPASHIPAIDPFRTTFSDAFYSTPFIAANHLYFPSAMIARRVWIWGERIQAKPMWAADVAVIREEASPLNVGLASWYNSANHKVSVTVEIYYTATVNYPLTVYAMLSENGILSYQSGESSFYCHNHIFRTALPQSNPAQWGETITDPTTAGSLTTLTYTFDNTNTNYDLSKCDVTVFVRNALNEEIITGNGAKVCNSTGVDEISQTILPGTFEIFPNPVNENTSLKFKLTSSSNVSYTITNSLGQLQSAFDLGLLPSGIHTANLNTGSLSKGVYFVRLKMGNSCSTMKMVKT